ncbi:hypothetical protein L0F63_001454 [Massospora cicadina]|nr:hypothetical protein L0F63_001454 [Massospora cicadina]
MALKRPRQPSPTAALNSPASGSPCETGLRELSNLSISSKDPKRSLGSQPPSKIKKSEKATKGAARAPNVSTSEEALRSLQLRRARFAQIPNIFCPIP